MAQTTTLKSTMQRKKNPMISCVIPVFNEAENIQPLIKAVWPKLQDHSSLCELIFVDDGSTDDSCHMITKMMQHYPVRLIQLSRNFGKEQAITAGLTHSHGDVVILMDADGQHPAEILPKFFKLWQQGYNMVYGIRNNRQDEGLVKRLGTKLFYQLLHLGSNTPIEKNAGDFRLMDRCFVNALCQLPERNRFMKGLYSWVGFKTIGIPFTVPQRKQGQSSFNLKRLVHLASTGITAFSTLPLLIWIFFGAIISIASFTFGGYILFKTLYLGVDLPGWATLVVLFSFLNGMLLLSIGIQGKYIANIYNEVKLRPPYIISYQRNYDDDHVAHQ
jgi:polyisoprenyl-phosphate glycosyltransferase